MTPEPGRAPPRHAHGDLTSLAPHERLPEILVVPREKTPTGTFPWECVSKKVIQMNIILSLETHPKNQEVLTQHSTSLVSDPGGHITRAERRGLRHVTCFISL